MRKKELFSYANLRSILSFLSIAIILSIPLNGHAQCVEVSTFAGMAGVAGDADGTGTAASFDLPFGITTDAAGNVYVADRFNNLIRKITPTGVVSTLAGMTGIGGSMDGMGTAASFDGPIGMTTDAAGNVYVADRANHTIRKITPAGLVSTFAGMVGIAGSVDGLGTAASFNSPSALTTDAAGNIYVTDVVGNLIRKITPSGSVSTLAGSGSAGSMDGAGAAASFNAPNGITVDAAGNLYVTEFFSHLIRKITPAGVVTTLAGMVGAAGSANGVGVAASFNAPSGVVVDAAGNLYVTDQGNHLIRKITPSGRVSTFAGTGMVGATDGQGTVASFDSPYGITLDAAGNFYVTDRANHLIRRIVNCEVSSPIPTMNQWGLLIFGLLILNLSIFFILKRKLI